MIERRLILVHVLIWTCILLLLVLLSPGKAHAEEARDVRVTYYLPTGNRMYSGQYPFVGAAACSWNFPLGTRLQFPDGRTVTCLDRGLLGDSGWVDVYAPSRDWGYVNVSGTYGAWQTVTVLD